MGGQPLPPKEANLFKQVIVRAEAERQREGAMRKGHRGMRRDIGLGHEEGHRNMRRDIGFGHEEGHEERILEGLGKDTGKTRVVGQGAGREERRWSGREGRGER